MLKGTLFLMNQEEEKKREEEKKDQENKEFVECVLLQKKKDG